MWRVLWNEAGVVIRSRFWYEAGVVNEAGVV